MKYQTKNLIFVKQWYVYWYNELFVLVLNVFCIATQLALNLLTVCAATAGIRLHADSSTMTVGVGQHSRKLITMHW